MQPLTRITGVTTGGVSTDLTERARTGDRDAFGELVAPYRRELQLHCYRMLASIHDAEDALQETLLAAWQGFATFEGRASVRTWLYRIATSRCLNLRRSESRRRRADGRMPELDLPEPTRVGEALWLEPYPDVLLEEVADRTPGPEARYETREAVSLAFVTALQLLPPRQRAVQILRDVLGYRAKEVAQILGATEASVTSALKRARATLQLRLPRPDERAQPPPSRSAAERALVERFTRAFESSDLESIVGLLTEDVSFTMPPLPFEWQGRDRALRFLKAMWQIPARRLVATRANGQPAFGLYLPDPHAGVLRAMGLLVLTLAGDRISAITRFENDALPYFTLPRTLRNSRPGAAAGPAPPH
jgi:RNA polymerase sigma-70 factor (TIGR02960 family)